MSRTSDALAMSTNSGVRVSPTIDARSGIALVRNVPLSAAYSRARSAQMRSISRAAASWLMPGFNRPITFSHCARRAATGFATTGPRSNAKKKSTWPIGPMKPSGRTPMIVRVTPLMRTSLPITLASVPKRRAHAGWERITGPPVS